MTGHASPAADLLADTLGWDIVNWSRTLRYWEEHTRLPPEVCSALEIGAEGNGGISLWMARRGMNVVCSGLRFPSDAVVEAHRRHGVAGRIRYAQVDALDMPYEAEFDVVALKSVLGGIGRHGRSDLQRRALQQAHRALKPGGELWFAENIRGTRLHEYLRNRFGSGQREWRYLSIDELPVLLQPFSEYRWETTGFAALFGRIEKLRRLLGKLDGALCRAIVPPDARYILMVLARKAESDRS